ncbi:MAG: pilus assembly protein TadG-related protein [Planctomycetota bacterium]|jgi:hypothetical protein
MKSLIANQPSQRRVTTAREGSIVVLAAAVLILVFAFTSFTVDLGFIALTRAELQNAADSAALGGAQELGQGIGAGPVASTSDIATDVRNVAESMASLNPAGDLDGVYIDPAQDVRLGRIQWDAATGQWEKIWGEAPYTLVEVVAHRDRGEAKDVNGKSLDGPLPLFFAPVIGHENATIVTRSAAAIFPGVGFRIDQNSSALADILPIAIDEETWDNLMAGVGSDDYAYDVDDGGIENHADGILEANLYPSGSSKLPPGNRGTVDIGSPNNSTKDLKRQILNGINAEDLSWFGGELRFDDVPVVLNGDTGLSAGIESSLKQIIGQPRAIPVFSQVSGPGNNAMYTIVKFVGIRIMDVKLTGSPSKKRVVIQPAPFSDSTVIRGETTVTTDSIFTKPALIQ